MTGVRLSAAAPVARSARSNRAPAERRADAGWLALEVASDGGLLSRSPWDGTDGAAAGTGFGGDTWASGVGAVGAAWAAHAANSGNAAAAILHKLIARGRGMLISSMHFSLRPHLRRSTALSHCYTPRLRPLVAHGAFVAARGGREEQPHEKKPGSARLFLHRAGAGTFRRRGCRPSSTARPARVPH